MKKEDTFILPQIQNLDELFLSTESVITLNELIVSKSSEEIVDILCDISSDDTEMLARCDCGKLVGNYYDGMTCPHCNTVCSLSFLHIVKNDLWIVAPAAITGILNPQVYHILNSWLGKCEKLPIMEILLNRRLPIPDKLKSVIPEQGFNAFYDNFPAIINYFSFVYKTTSTKPIVPYLGPFLEQFKDKIWCTRLPLVSKSLQPITRMGNNNRYVDGSIKLLMKLMTDFKTTLIDMNLADAQLPRVEKNFFSVYKVFTQYTKDLVKNKIAAKKGILRKHCFGSRFHLSARTVCVPIVGEHWGDELYLPWMIGVQLYKYHIKSLLVNRYHKTDNDAYNQIMLALTTYDYQIDQCIQTLIKECPYKGIPIILNRNPSLKLGAIQLLFVTKVKPALHSDPKVKAELDISDQSLTFLDSKPTKKATYVIPQEVQDLIKDKTLEISPMVINAPNADFANDISYLRTFYHEVLPTGNSGIVSLELLEYPKAA